MKPVLECQCTEGYATEKVIEWKHDIGRRYYWVADEIVEDFAAEFLSTPDEIKYSKNNVVKLRQLAEYSATHEVKARLLMALLRKHNEDAFWALVDGAEGQEGTVVFI